MTTQTTFTVNCRFTGLPFQSTEEFPAFGKQRHPMLDEIRATWQGETAYRSMALTGAMSDTAKACKAAGMTDEQEVRAAIVAAVEAKRENIPPDPEVLAWEKARSFRGR